VSCLSNTQADQASLTYVDFLIQSEPKISEHSCSTVRETWGTGAYLSASSEVDRLR
jgi:hypothetical protein